MGQINETETDERFGKICGEELMRAMNEGDSESIKRWTKYLSRKFKNLHEQWGVVGLAISNVENWGRYRAMIELSIKQIEIAQEIKTKAMQSDSTGSETLVSINTILADSYLSLARSNLRLSEFIKCTDYCTKSFSFVGKCRGAGNETTTRIAGEIHLCRGSAQLRLGNYRKALEDLERALSIATSQQNTDLECMSCCALGRLYLNLKDFEKEAMKYAMETGDRGSQAYCVLSFADIHRARRDSDKALPRYESATSMMREIGDRYGEVKSLVGKAKMHLKKKLYLETMRDYQNAFRIAELIQAKMECLTIQGELALTYQRMNKLEEARGSLILYHKLLEEMNLYCGACKEPISEKHQQLEALPCAHIFHLKCVSERGFINTRACPNCRQTMTKPPS